MRCAVLFFHVDRVELKNGQTGPESRDKCNKQVSIQTPRRTEVNQSAVLKNKDPKEGDL